MSDPQTHTPAVPYLPDELKIHILSFIDEPYFLWTTCRYVSPQFKEWVEKQYARDYLTKLQLEIRITGIAHQHAHKQMIHHNPLHDQTLKHDYIKSKIRFYVHSLDSQDATRAILKPLCTPMSRVHAGQLHLGRDERLHWISTDDALGLLEDFSMCTMMSQIYPEFDLGLRKSSDLCPCRIVPRVWINPRTGAQSTCVKIACERYKGVQRFLYWGAQERVLRVGWVQMIDYIHARMCDNSDVET